MTRPDDPIGVDTRTAFVPKDLPKEWRDKVLELATSAKGLTKREWYAGLAMNGAMSAMSRATGTAAEVAHIAVVFADALIAELTKTEAK